MARLSSPTVWIVIALGAVVLLAAVFVFQRSSVTEPGPPIIEPEPVPPEPILPTPDPPTPSPEDTVVLCTQEYAPVCGVNGRTYSNRCVAEQQAKVKVAHEGECRGGLPPVPE